MSALIALLTTAKGKGQVRHMLSLVGGFLVLRGLVPEEAMKFLDTNLDAILEGVGALCVCGSMWWSWKSKKEAPAGEAGEQK